MSLELDAGARPPLGSAGDRREFTSVSSKLIPDDVIDYVDHVRLSSTGLSDGRVLAGCWVQLVTGQRRWLDADRATESAALGALWKLVRGTDRAKDVTLTAREVAFIRRMMHVGLSETGWDDGVVAEDPVASSVFAKLDGPSELNGPMSRGGV